LIFSKLGFDYSQIYGVSCFLEIGLHKKVLLVITKLSKGVVQRGKNKRRFNKSTRGYREKVRKGGDKPGGPYGKKRLLKGQTTNKPKGQRGN